MEDKAYQFRQWILTQTSDEYTMTEEEKRILLKTKYAEAQICFHEMQIIEYQIIRLQDEQNVFYLHFQLNDELHAEYLFEEMKECLLKTREAETINILLSCSSALTTSYFAHKLNQTAELLDLPYHFYASSVSQIPSNAYNCRMVLLAPQIAFARTKILSFLPDLPVIVIPASLFGAYDVQGILDMVTERLNRKRRTAEKLILLSDRKIMIISTRIDEQFKISWRVYYRGKIIRKEITIKDRIDIHDFEDIMDVVSAYEKDIETVVISMPGIVNEGKVTLRARGFSAFPMRDYLSAKYPYNFIITNNANATALGIYHMEQKYDTIVYHSQLVSGNVGGQGIVIDGKVVTGKNGIAGEINYLRRHEDLMLKDRAQSAVRTAANAILADIAVIGPDAVFIRCNLIKDAERIRLCLLEKVEESYIPEIRIIGHSGEYMYYGAQVMADRETF